MQLTLDSGRFITLSRLQQQATYAGLLAGVPERSRNAQRLAELQDAARAWSRSDALLLIPPQVTPLEPPERLRGPAAAGALHFERLPAVACMAVFDSGPFDRPDAEPYTALTVLWLQEAFGLPEAGVRAALCGLDWEGRAVEWGW